MSEGFFPDVEVKNPGAGEEWDPLEQDQALDLYCAGELHPREIGIKFKSSPRAFTNSILNKLRYNFKKKPTDIGRAERYVQHRRVSRVGLRWTMNEIDMIRCHRKLKLPASVTAEVLARTEEEVEAFGK